MSNRFLMINNDWFKLIGSYDNNGKSRKLDSIDVIILSMIYSWQREGRECYLSNEQIGDVIGLQYSAVRERITFLSNIGLISRSTYYTGKERRRTMFCNLDRIEYCIDANDCEI